MGHAPAFPLHIQGGHADGGVPQVVCWAGKLGWHATDGLMMRHGLEGGDGLAGAD